MTSPNVHTGDEATPLSPALAAEIARNAGQRTADVTDARGRKIKIRKLTAFDRLRLFEALGGELSDNAMYFGYSMSASCVISIDGTVEAPPIKKIQIEAMIQRLDDDGLEAVAKGYRENFRGAESGDPAAIKK
jgi:hypothetical protein